MLKRYFFALTLSTTIFSHLPTEQQTIEQRKSLNLLIQPYCTSVPEGGFVYFFNKELFPYLEKDLTRSSLSQLKKRLSPHLTIPLSREGFTMASTRRGEDDTDETNYSAIWVRDTCWHYFGLATDSQSTAKKLLLNLLTFYSTPEQLQRFLAVIANPSIADPAKNPNALMDVPLIRFSRKTLSHHQINGNNQTWNHLQFDSHGLFLLALTNAFQNNLISSSDLTDQMIDLLALFPAFFAQTAYSDRKDAGPWEEELMNNASTIGLIAAGLKGYKNTLLTNVPLKKRLVTAAKGLSPSRVISSNLQEKALDTLIAQGVSRVEYNLNLGCEAPDLDGSGNHRRADAALLFLCYPEGALYYNDEAMTQKILNITLGLVGPYGVFRYKLDAYQSMNYWIDHNIPSAIMGPKTTDLTILTRFDKGYMPANQPYDAQWFFDSIFASIYYHLSEITDTSQTRFFYRKRGDIHLKRALGQLTGEGAIAANGEKLPPMSLPESINTVFDTQYPHRPLPSPIAPLTWSVATMRLALENATKAHSQ